MKTPSFAASRAPTPLLPALRGIIGIIGGFEIGQYGPCGYQKLPQTHRLPYTPLDIGEYDVITISCQEISTLSTIFSLLTYAYDREGVAEHLWELLKREEAVNRLLQVFVAIENFGVPVEEHVYTCRTNGITLTPVTKYSWERIAHALSHSVPFKKTLRNFARSYFENLIIPFMTPQPPPPISPNTHGHIQSAYKSLLVARDGHRTVVGGVWNYDRPEDLIVNDIERQELIEEDYVVPTHVIPFFGGGGGGINHKMIYYMQKFCGYDVAEEIMMDSYDDVNSPKNGLLLTPELYTSFRKLRWCIEADEIIFSRGLWHGNMEDEKKCTYNMRLLTRGKHGGLHLHNDKDVLRFGQSYAGIPSPKAVFCNVHASIAKVLRASGAGGAVEAILRNEQTMKEEASTGANWGDLGRDYLVRRLSAISDEGL